MTVSEIPHSFSSVNPEKSIPIIDDLLAVFSGAKVVFYPCINRDITSQKISDKPVGVVKLNKCRCGSVWCPDCVLKHVRSYHRRLSTWDWRAVRHVMITTSRDDFDSGEAAYDALMGDNHRVPDFLQSLQRAGIVILDWFRNIEWHTDGYPHIHILILVDRAGKAGMIGGDLLRRCWKWGEYVHESYIKSEVHWREMIGYFGKTGYMVNGTGSDKAHQAVLPEWALERSKKIRRFSAKQFHDGRGEEWPGDPDKEFKGQGKSRAPMRNYRVILMGCGDKTRLRVQVGSKESRAFLVHLPMEEIMEGFELVRGVGRVRYFTYLEMSKWFKGNSLLNIIWDDIEFRKLIDSG